MAIKNQYLLLGVVLLACLSAGLTVALFFSLQSNEHQFNELKRRLDDLEFRRLPALEEPSQQSSVPQSWPETANHFADWREKANLSKVSTS